MPIYAYKCAACGFAKDVLQKMSDARLTVCPTCHASTFEKQLTAAGFQLKGSGWYVTDFRDGGSNTGAKPGADGASGGDSKPAADSGAAPAAPAAAAPAASPAPAAAPASAPAAATSTSN